ncbi:ABC transporter permease subunit [Sporosarcina luteola]|uniref:ABC transporter permease subunit n=1 Tax=Sporosarcina luteola TaxID=582850 RepID=UPI00203B77C4|nr:ABC transporter permease subunit [Sporosarcina luteola]MCM3710629.1 ABC transporter permease subunit [Sporosarcina luteola]
MGLLKFEMKKVFRQKKLVWLFVVVLLGVAGVFYQNYSEREAMKERALESIRPYSEEVDARYHFYKEREYNDQLDEAMRRQQEHIVELGTIFFRWKGVIHNGGWSEIPAIENDFLKSVALFEEAEGGFGSLYGMEREKAIQKNAWLLKQELPYVDEEFPLSPALMLKQSSNLLLSVGGFLFLVLFFGNIVTSEKEQQTWLTLKTQPIAKWKRIVAKYTGVLIVIFGFLLMVLCVGLLIPYVFGEQAWNFTYPQLIQSGESFTFISTTAYLVRIFMLFFCAGALVFSFIMLLSTQFRSSFAVLVMTGFVGAVGYSATLLNEGFQTFWNPFHLLSMTTIVSETVDGSFWLYPIAAVCWSLLLLTVGILMPEGERGLFGATDMKKPFGDGKTRHVLTIWNSARFEWRKLKRQGLLRQSIIVLGLFAVIGYFLLGQVSHKKEAEYVEGLDESIAMYRSIVQHSEEELASLDEDRKAAEESGDEGWIRYYNDVAQHQRQTMLAYFEDILSNYEMGKRAYEEGDWQSFYQYQLFNNRQSSGEFTNEYMFWEIGGRSYVMLEASKAEKEWLMKHNVRPIISGDDIPTIYESWGDKETKNWHVEKNRKVDNSGLFSLFLYFDNYVYFIPILLLLVVFGAGFAGEKGKRPTIQTLQTQPVAVRSIFFGKVTTAIIVGISGLVGVFAFVLLVSTLFNRFGDWYYPIFHYNSKKVVEADRYTGMRALEGGFDFMPLGEYVLSGIALSVCIFLFLLAMTHVLGLFVPRAFVVYSCVALICGVGYFIGGKLGDFAQFSPFTYLDIGRIVNGEVATVLNNPSVTVLNGCWVLLGVSVLLVVAGYGMLGLRSRVKREVTTGQLVVGE